jgi:ParB-like chromosome segregation protein Spo0J
MVSGPYEDGNYHLIDGAHRFKSVQTLGQSKEEEIRKQYENYDFQCYVLNKLERNQEMALAYGIHAC